MERDQLARRPWNDDETILALYLYFQLPFGKLHRGNPEIQQLAAALGRTSSSVAMKLSNFASLDPKITESGRKGLAGASQRDRTTYTQFGHDWSGLVARAEGLWALRVERPGQAPEPEHAFTRYDGPSTTPVVIQQRVGQNFFRRAVLVNYGDACCITGIADPRLLTASHIKPWAQDSANRHNPANGLLLCATLDRAFDRGLITVDPRQRIVVSRQLTASPSPETRAYFEHFQEAPLRRPERFEPDPEFLAWHNQHCFVDRVSV